MKNRKPNRLHEFDYSKDASYFVTSCCYDRINHFGEIKNMEMILNDFGEIAEQQIEWLKNQYPYLIIHNHVIMPNHLHILMEINRSGLSVGTGCDLSLQKHDLSLQNHNLPQQKIEKIKSVSSLMGAYKTTTSKLIHLAGNTNFGWQRSFHDNIIRNQEAFDRIFEYITNNPMKWEIDRFNVVFNSNYLD